MICLPPSSGANIAHRYPLRTFGFPSLAHRARAPHNAGVAAGLGKSQTSFILASAPAALIGIWNLGTLMAEHPPASANSWQLALLERLGAQAGSPGILAAVLYGSVFFVPLFVASLAASRLWAELFARARHRPLDPGWALWAWLYTLLLPATLPVHFAVLGLSFGVVFGAHVFGGTGRYLVNPALLGTLFVAVAYPGLMAAQWVPGNELPSSWALAATEGIEALVAAGQTWDRLVFGREIGALGAGSALACLVGVAALIVRREVSPQLVAAGCAGLAVAGMLGGDLPWHWHLVLGNFAFVLAFIATDPTTRPTTRGGLWAFGALFGALTIVLRTANPEHPEGTLFALMLASLFAPSLDRLALLGRAASGPVAAR